MGLRKLQRGVVRRLYRDFKAIVAKFTHQTPFLGYVLNRLALLSTLQAAFRKDAADREADRLAKESMESSLVPAFDQAGIRTDYDVEGFSSILERLRSVQAQLAASINSTSTEMALPTAVAAISMNSGKSETSPVLSIARRPIATDLETEVIKMCGSLYHGPVDTQGSIHSSNAESILAACRAYRNFAKSKGIETPEMIIPSTASNHLIRAALECGIKLVTIPVNSKTLEVDVEATEAAITKNTILIIASAPASATGGIDPIEALGKIATEHHISLHVDATAGGYLLPLASEVGATLPPFDFSVPGVTSISANGNRDVRTELGPSMLLFRSSELAKFQDNGERTWSFGNAMASSSEGDVTKAWASMVYPGISVQGNITQRLLALKNELFRGIQAIPGIEVIGEPKLGVIAVHSRMLNAHLIAKKLREKGYKLNFIDSPKAFTIALSTDDLNKPDFCHSFLIDLSAAVGHVRLHPQEPLMGSPLLFAMMKPGPTARNFILELSNDVPGSHGPLILSKAAPASTDLVPAEQARSRRASLLVPA